MGVFDGLLAAEKGEPERLDYSTKRMKRNIHTGGGTAKGPRQKRNTMGTCERNALRAAKQTTPGAKVTNGGRVRNRNKKRGKRGQ